MSDKQMMDYQKLLERLETEPSKFLMIGNSLKSDVLPVLELGGFAVHVPFHTTWLHEKIDHEVQHPNFWSVQKVSEIPALLNL
jgi:putative hydrolase of the HAD superfamily